MILRQPFPVAPLTIPLGGLILGIVFAVIGGLGVESSGQNQAVQAGGAPIPPRVETIRPVFSPFAGSICFLPGAMVGSAIGAIWGRSRVSHAIAVVLVTLVGGSIGLFCAAWFGAESKIAASENSIETQYGASPIVIAAGTAIGILIGAVAAWGMSPRTGGVPRRLNPDDNVFSVQ